eukprot:1741632-Pleurochrysis_carterae.AAC.4
MSTNGGLRAKLILSDVARVRSSDLALHDTPYFAGARWSLVRLKLVCFGACSGSTMAARQLDLSLPCGGGLTEPGMT